MSSVHLVDCAYRDCLPSDIPTIIDYFGDFTDKKTLPLLFGVYQGLIKYKNVTSDLLHMCFLSNRLDELIHKKFTHKPSGYYQKFKDQNLIIGNTNLLNTKNKKTFEIYDDDYCPYCNTKGFLTNNNTLNIDCTECYKFLCKKCAYLGDEDLCLHKRCQKLIS